MATNPQQTELVFTAAKIQRHRETKRMKIEQFFAANIGKAFNSQWLHGMFGSAVRSRISEIRRDPESPIRIENCTEWDDLAKREISSYRAVRR